MLLVVHFYLFYSLQKAQINEGNLPAKRPGKIEGTTILRSALNSAVNARRSKIAESQQTNESSEGSVGNTKHIVEGEVAISDETEGNLVIFEVSNLDGGASGTFTVKTRPDWAPLGVKRFEELVSLKFFDECRTFRVIPSFIAQFGINGDPEISRQWRQKVIPDDPVKISNKRGTLTFATSGPNTRTTQLFINTSDSNKFLDKQGFAPIAEVVSGMDIVDKLYAGYGEGAPQGKGPDQGMIQNQGNVYLEEKFPMLSYFRKVSFQ